MYKIDQGLTFSQHGCEQAWLIGDLNFTTENVWNKCHNHRLEKEACNSDWEPISMYSHPMLNKT